MLFPDIQSHSELKLLELHFLMWSFATAADSWAFRQYSPDILTHTGMSEPMLRKQSLSLCRTNINYSLNCKRWYKAPIHWWWMVFNVFSTGRLTPLGVHMATTSTSTPTHITTPYGNTNFKCRYIQTEHARISSIPLFVSYIYHNKK